MRFKVDENLPIDVAEILRANNHDAMTIFDQEMVGQPDLKVASVCRAEERALVTLTSTFPIFGHTRPQHMQESLFLGHAHNRNTMFLLCWIDSFLC